LAVTETRNAGFFGRIRGILTGGADRSDKKVDSRSSQTDGSEAASEFVDEYSPRPELKRAPEAQQGYFPRGEGVLASHPYDQSIKDSVRTEVAGLSAALEALLDSGTATQEQLDKAVNAVDAALSRADYQLTEYRNRQALKDIRQAQGTGFIDWGKGTQNRLVVSSPASSLRPPRPKPGEVSTRKYLADVKNAIGGRLELRFMTYFSHHDDRSSRQIAEEKAAADRLYEKRFRAGYY